MEDKKKSLEIEYLEIEKIKPYEDNPRQNDDAVEIVARSIKEFGFKVPVILDKKGELIAGHTRIKAAMQLGMTEVPAIYAKDLNEKQIKAFRIMDNKTQEYSIWDDELLVKEFKFLKKAGFDLELTGFTNEEVNTELKLNEVENVNLFDERDKVIALMPPEAIRLKEREGFFCENIKEYNKIKKYFKENNKLNVKRLLELIKWNFIRLCGVMFGEQDFLQ